MAKAKKKSRSKAPARRGKAGRSVIKPDSLAIQAYEQIKSKIITIYFLPGQYLNESALCDLLGAGRTPVHQALQRLQMEGLVEIMPRKGVIVQPDSISEILKILDSRAAIEAELARNAARWATPDQARHLLALARNGYGNGSPASIDEFIGADRQFHAKLAELSDNPVLSNFARTLHERSIRYWYLHLWQTLDVKATIRQHASIAEMIAKGDGEGAAKAVREHIVSLRGRLIRAQGSSETMPRHRTNRPRAD